MDFYRQLNNITDISEFIEKFIDPDSIDPSLGIRGNYYIWICNKSIKSLKKKSLFLFICK